MLSPQEVTKVVIEKQILGRKLTGGDLTEKLKAYAAQTQRRSWSPMNAVADGDVSVPYSRDKVLSDLKDLAGTRQHWVLIYLSVFAYVGWQWRIGWRWGLMEKRPGQFYAWLVGLSLVFSLFFFGFGRAGAGGQDRVRSVTIARRVTDRLFDVEGWSVVGTGLSGGEHLYSVPGSGQLYGATESFGQNSMQIRDSKIVIDLPAFATQRVAFRTRVEMPEIPVRLDSAGLDMWQSKSARLVIDPTYKAPVYAAIVVLGEHVYEFSGKSGTLKPTEFWQTTMQEWINPFSLQNAKGTQVAPKLQWAGCSTREPRTISSWTPLRRWWGMGFPSVRQCSPIHSPSRMATRVMLYTDMPSELIISGDFPDQQGRMLYVTDIPLAGGR